MNKPEKFRLVYIYHGMNESRKRLLGKLNTEGELNSLAINSSLSEVLFWICAFDEWYKKNANKGKYQKNKVHISEKNKENIKKNISEKQECVSGLRYVFNLLKHDMSFVKLIRADGQKDFLGFKMEDYSKGLKWVYIDNLIEKNSKYRSQRENYQKHLEGKNVIETLNAAWSYLGELYMELKKH